MLKCDNCSAEYELKHEMDREHYIAVYCPFGGWEREEADEEYLDDISFHDSDD
jgi:formate-dependent nitrite reductase cytochrome c552 subunit